MSTLLALADDIAADRSISAEDALRLRKEIFPDGVITRQEAGVLIALEARVGESDETWSQAFVEALVDHVLQSGEHRGHVDEPTAAWLAASFAGQAPRQPELEALVKILERAESTPEGLQSYVRTRIAEFVAGRAMTAADVELVRRCIYAGPDVTEKEVRWLFALDVQCNGRDNDPAWRDLFVKASLCHVEGRASPAVLAPEAMLAREERLAHRPGVNPLSVLASIAKGGFGGYIAHLREGGAAQGMEERYEAANAQTEDDARLTGAEMAEMLGLTEADGKHTPNEEALLAELRKHEAGQPPEEDWA